LNLQGLTGVSTADLGLRFNVVSLLPDATLVLFVLALTASGAPAESPKPGAVLAAIDKLNAQRVAAMLALVLIASLILHPFQFSLVRLLEGYWESSRIGRPLSALGKELHRRRRQRLDQLAHDPQTPQEQERQQWAKEMLDQYPDEDRLLPTRLGNTLRAAEDEAGARYKLPTVTIMPRLYPYFSDRFAAVYVDRRNQLDAAVRFCAILALAAVISGAMLLTNGGAWRVLPVAIAVLTWVSYQAALRAAANFGQALFVAFDLHRFDMIKALHYTLPANRPEELDFNQRLGEFFTGDELPHDIYDHGDQK
jgi:cell division protein FtsB